jgi:CheY-like chemotaxis protein
VNARDAIVEMGNITIETQNVMLDEAYCADHAGFIPGAYTMLTVSDDGCGMDKETLENLFEPFFTTKKVGEGSGLGLSTVYGIVKQNDGFINVYSEAGQGAIFKIYLLRTRETVEATGVPVAKTIVKGTETVLMVEDEESILRLGKTILERFGYTVLTADTPGKALATAKRYKDPIHLLVTDVVMPEMNGKVLRDGIENLQPNIKVLFMSGYTANVIMQRGILESDVHFLQKPFSINSLADKVREVLDEVKSDD